MTPIIPMDTRARQITGGGFGRHLFLMLTFCACLMFQLATPQVVRAVQANASSSSSDYAAELMNRADTAWDNERYDEAADAYRQAFMVDPSNKRAAYRLGWCYNEQQKYGDAEWALKDAVRLDPTDEKARAELGFAYRSAERYQEAIETYQQLLKLNPKSVDAHYYIGWVHNERGEYRDAIDSLREALRLDPERGEAFEDLGYAYRQAGKFDEAVEAYSKAAELEPDEAAPLKALADIYFSDLKQYEKAVLSYRETLKLNSGDTPSQYNLGWALNELGKPDEAIDSLTLVTQVEPRNVDAWNELGFAFRKTKENDSAFYAFSRSLKLAPDSAAGHFGLADLLFFNVKDYKAAIDEYTIGLHLEADGKAFRNMGAAYNALSHYADAIPPLEKAVKLRPDDSGIYLELGIAYEGLDKTDKAVTAFQNAVRLAPESTEAQSRLNKYSVKPEKRQ